MPYLASAVARLRRLLVQAACIGMAACGSGDGGSDETPAAPQAPATVSIRTASLVKTGQAATFETDVASATGLSFNWAFGDGSQSTGSVSSHSYQLPGLYEVNLTVRDAAGRQTVSSTRVTVRHCTADGWCRQAPTEGQTRINAVYFADAATGWAVGDFGLIRRTEDGGLSWSDTYLDGALPLTLVHFADRQRGWVAGPQAQMWRTVDGGAHWTHLGAAPAAHVDRLVSAANLLLAFSGQGSSKRNWASDDDGATWREISASVVQAESNGVLWACSQTCVDRSTDGGLSFAPFDAGLGTGWRMEPVTMGFGTDGWAWQLQYGFSGSRALLRAGLDATWVPLQLPDTGALIVHDGLYFDGQGGWTLIRPSSTGETSLRIWHADAPNTTWREVSLPPDFDPRCVDGSDPCVQVLDGRTVVLRSQLYGGAGRQFKAHLTTDGGRSWVEMAGLRQQAQLDETAYLVQLARQAGLVAWVAAVSTDAVGNTSMALPRAYRSLDDGRTWFDLPGTQAPRYAITGLAWADAQRGLGTTSQAGLLLQTVNGGLDWAAATPLARGGTATALQFADPTHGWMLVDGHLMNSADGGQTWSDVAVPTSRADGLLRLQVLSNQHLFVSAQSDPPCPFRNWPDFVITGPSPVCRALFSSSDGGRSWARQATWAEEWYATTAGFDFVSPSAGLTTDAGWLYRTADGGATWAQTLPFVQSTNSTVPGGRVRYQDAQRVWALGLYGGLLRSLDGGQSWSVVTLPIETIPQVLGPALTDILFIDANRGWLVGVGGLLLATTDGGETWQQQKSGTAAQLLWLSAKDGALWAGGDHGLILQWQP